MEGYPFGFCFWVYRTVAREGYARLFCSAIHDEEVYGGHWKFGYSGSVQIISPSIHQKAEISLDPAHTTRGGFFLWSKNFPRVEAPFLITDALDVAFKGYYEITFSPHDPEIRWASHEAEEFDGCPIVYEVLGRGFFGRIHFTGLDTAVVMAFTAGAMAGPTLGERLNFANNSHADPIGIVQSERLIDSENVAPIFQVGM